MLGLGETEEEVLELMRNLREHAVDMLTVSQYQRPRAGNASAPRPTLWRRLESSRAMGLARVARGALVRTIFYAGRQALGAGTA